MPRVIFYCNEHMKEFIVEGRQDYEGKKLSFLSKIRKTGTENVDFDVLVEVSSQGRESRAFFENYDDNILDNELKPKNLNLIQVHLIPFKKSSNLSYSDRKQMIISQNSGLIVLTRSPFSKNKTETAYVYNQPYMPPNLQHAKPQKGPIVMLAKPKN